MLIGNGASSGRCTEAGFKEMMDAQAQLENAGESEQAVKRRAACDECSKLQPHIFHGDVHADWKW